MNAGPYRHLMSPLRIRNTTLPNRVVFAPVCPTWVRSPHEGVFTEQAVAYYEERAKTGIGMIILGGHLIDRDTIYTPMGFPGLWNDAQLEGLANVARAVKRHGCALSVQLLHLGLRSPTPFLKTDPARDPYEYNPYMLAPSQQPAGEIPGGPTPKELEEHEIEYILQCFEDAARRAISAGLDGVEFHLAHGYLPWQFLSPFYNRRTDRWGGSYENRLRFSIEAMRRIRRRIGDRPFLGYRINSTSFWEGDLEIDDVKRVHADLEKAVDLDYVSVSAGVHHSWIHTPMTFEEGWEREYTRAIKTVSTKPVLLVGRVSHPGVADESCLVGRCRRHPARPADDCRRAVDDQGEAGPGGRHPPLRRRELLLARRHPRQPRAMRLQSGGRPRSGVGRELDDQGVFAAARAGDRSRPRGT